MTLQARVIAVLLLILAAIGVGWRIDRKADARGYDRAMAEVRAQVETFRTNNLELQRAAEKRYTVQAETRDRFIVTTVKEIRDATSHLATCPVGAPAVRLLNDAGRCARGDSPAACGAREPVPRSP